MCTPSCVKQGIRRKQLMPIVKHVTSLFLTNILRFGIYFSLIFSKVGYHFEGRFWKLSEKIISRGLNPCTTGIQVPSWGRCSSLDPHSCNFWSAFAFRDVEGLKCFYYLVQDLKCLVFSLIALHFKIKPIWEDISTPGQSRRRHNTMYVKVVVGETIWQF